MSVKPEFTPTWRDWILTNLRRECAIESIVGAMVRDGFDPPFAEAVVAVLKTERSEGTRWPEDGANHESPNTVPGRAGGDYVYESSRLPPGNVMVTEGRTVRVLARLKQPEVVVFGGLLSDDECDELIRLSKPKLIRSTTVDPATGQSLVIDRRTSSGTFFHLEENDFITRLDRRLAEVTRWPVDHSEGLQILHYQDGGEYRPHFDCFPPADAGSATHTRDGGQRIGTVVMYLNNVDEGGETIFPEIGLTVAPRRGNAVYFGYCNSRNQVDPSTLHGGAPVRRGEKWIATTWLRKEQRR